MIIKDIQRGTGSRSCYVYACLYNDDGELLISATLDHITERVFEMTTPGNPQDAAAPTGCYFCRQSRCVCVDDGGIR